MGMQPWFRMVLAVWLGLAGLGVAQADDQEPSVREAVSDILLAMSGTAHIYDSPRIARALDDASSYKQGFGRGFDQRRLERLLQDAGFRIWRERPRLWVLGQTDSGWRNMAASNVFVRAAQRRALLLTDSEPDAAAQTLVGKAVAGDETGLPTLLQANAADALLVVRRTANGASWQFIQPGRRLTGEFVGAELESGLPHVLSERLAAGVQWPEASGRALLLLQQVGSFSDLMAAQAALTQNPVIKGVSLVRVDGSRAYFAVDITAVALKAALAADARFATVSEAAAELSPDLLRGLRLGSVLQIRAWTPPPATTLP